MGEPRIIVAREKHGTSYFDASTDEQWARSALHLLTERWNQGYWYTDPNELIPPEETEVLSEEEIGQLPVRYQEQERRRTKQAEARRRSKESYREWYDAAKEVVENEDLSMISRGKPGTRFYRELPRAWDLLDQRSDYEYERVELVDVLRP